MHPGAINSIPSKSHIEIGQLPNLNKLPHFILFFSRVWLRCSYLHLNIFNSGYSEFIFGKHYIIPDLLMFSECLSADTRDIDEKRRNVVIEKIHHSATSIAEKRNVKLTEFKIVNQDPPALADGSVVKAMEAATKELNLSHKLMISRAYHDSLFMARYK